MINGDAVLIGKESRAISNEASYGIFKDLSGEGGQRKTTVYEAATLRNHFGSAVNGEEVEVAFRSYTGDKRSFTGIIDRVTDKSVRVIVNNKNNNYISTIKKVTESWQQKEE